MIQRPMRAQVTQGVGRQSFDPRCLAGFARVSWVRIPDKQPPWVMSQQDLNQARLPEFHNSLDAGCGLRAVSLLEIRAQLSIA